jgi:tRNA pseudouridine32 synthase/23S rRNA pseudouridine746 synthase
MEDGQLQKDDALPPHMYTSTIMIHSGTFPFGNCVVWVFLTLVSVLRLGSGCHAAWTSPARRRRGRTTTGPDVKDRTVRAVTVANTPYLFGTTPRYCIDNSDSPPLEVPGAPHDDVDVPVLFQDDQILVVHKPSGVAHHNDADTGRLGILNLIRHQQTTGRFAYPHRLYGVHRLDRVTSGILVLAKTPGAAQILTQAWREDRVTKYYVGLSGNKATTSKQGHVRGRMIRGRRRSWLLTRETHGSNVAHTRFFTAGLGHLAPPSSTLTNVSPKTLLLFRPTTGRTHQLRVAAKSVGLPLWGDPVYRDGRHRTENASTPSRTLLHAAGWHVPADDTHPEWTLWCPPPPEFDVWANPDARDTENPACFDSVLHRLLHKHVDCEPLLYAIDAAASLGTTRVGLLHPDQV